MGLLQMWHPRAKADPPDDGSGNKSSKEVHELFLLHVENCNYCVADDEADHWAKDNAHEVQFKPLHKTSFAHLFIPKKHPGCEMFIPLYV